MTREELRFEMGMIRYLEANGCKVSDLKRKWRKALAEYNERESYVVWSDDCNFMELIPVICDDGEEYTKEEIEEAFRNSDRFYERPNSWYDCTGKLFTVWYKVFKRRGQWHVYHMVGADV